MASYDDGATVPGLEDLSLAHRAEIGRMESALFGRPLSPVQIGGFTVTRTIGRGAFGTVFEARDPRLGRDVAIKVLAASDPGSQEKLAREATMMATVAHPNVAAVYEVGTFVHDQQTKVFVAMELVDGVTLRKVVQDGQSNERELVGLLAQAGAGLAAAHAAGVIHRDFKPDNVLVGSDGRVRVVDFGLASTRVGVTTDREDVELEPKSPATLTRGPVGTPAYMAPEVFEGAPPDALADQFSLCVTLYEALYGQRPFAGETLAKLVRNVASGTFAVAPQGTRVSARLRRILVRGLSSDPAARYPSVDALLQDLGTERWSVRRQMLAAAGVATLAGVALGATMTHSEIRAVPPCAVKPAAIDDAVDPGRLTEAAAAFSAATPGYGADVWQRTEPRLKDYTDRWRQAAAASCERGAESEESRRLRELEAECLADGQRRLEGLVTALTRATPELVSQSIRATRALPAPSRCVDVAALLVSAPSDPAQRAEATRIRRALAIASTDYTAGRYDDLRTELHALRSDAATLGFAPLLAEVDNNLAQLDLKTGRYAESRTRARDAFDTAIAAGDQRTAAAATVLMSQAGVADPVFLQEGLDWARTGASLVEQLDSEPRLASSLALARASLLITAGDFEGAPAALQAAIDSMTAEDPEHPDLSMAIGNWGTLELLRGRTSEAIAKYEQALYVAEATVGPQHPDVAKWLLGLGSASLTVDELDAAEGYLDRSLAIHRLSVGDDHPDTVQTLMYLGVLERSREQFPAALARFEEALQAAQRLTPPQPPAVADVCLRYADALSSAGKHERAAEISAKALAIHESMFPEGDARRATALGVAMVTASRAGRPQEAVALGLRALGVSASVGDVHPMTVNLLHETGRILVELGRIDEALALFDRAALALASGVEDPRRAAAVQADRAAAKASAP